VSLSLIDTYALQRSIDASSRFNRPSLNVLQPLHHEPQLLLLVLPIIQSSPLREEGVTECIMAHGIVVIPVAMLIECSASMLRAGSDQHRLEDIGNYST
jgi:hypothetical protein